MQNRIEPPILVSRLMTFVMATSVVVLVVLIITLDKMFPLNRPQIFFLRSQMVDNKELSLTDMPEDLDWYKRQFVREYVRERNEISENLAETKFKWDNTTTGVIRARSTDDVFEKFGQTDLVNLVYRDDTQPLDMVCTVTFPAGSTSVKPYVKEQKQDAYVVEFTYQCNYSQVGKYTKRYNVLVTLESTEKEAVKWSERMENPLGFKVSDYVVLRNQVPVDDDPLNWIRKIDFSENQTDLEQYDVLY